MKYRSQIIILNGTSSAGKSTLSKILQSKLSTPYLHVGIDTFIDLMPEHINQFKIPNKETIGFWCKGTRTPLGDPVDKIMLGTYAKKMVTAYHNFIVSLVENGHNIILDEVFLDGLESYKTWKKLLAKFQLLFVGVCPDLNHIEMREIQRGDRHIGTARSQYHIIHKDIPYDLVIDNGVLSNEQCAQKIIEKLK